MDNYKLSLIKNDGKKYDITSVIGGLSWKDNIDTLGMELSFSILRNKEDKYMKNHDVVEVGDKLILLNNDKETFRGIVVDLDTARYGKSIAAFDYAFYLNKSKTIKQFKKILGSDVIKQLCNEFKIPIGKIESISTQINKIYKDETISEIIKDVLSQSTQENGIKYRLEMREGKLFVEKYSDLIVIGGFKPAQNITKFNVLNAIGSISKSESITEMRNSILISSGDEESVRVIASAKDDKNIGLYGLLQEVESVDDKDIGQVNNIVKNRLVELNRIGEEISLELLGDDKVRSGRILEIKNEIYNLDGRYLVKDCTHNYQNGIHTMSITVEVM